MPDRLKILMLNYEFPPIGGGGGKAHLNLLKEYAKRKNLVVDVLTSSPTPKNSTEQFGENITIYKVGVHKKELHYWRKVEVLEWLFKSQTALRKLLSGNNYDLAHAFFGFPTGWLTYHHRKKLPYIISLRGSDVPGYNVRLKLDYYLLKGLFHKIWQNAGAVIANSQGLAELATQFEPSLDIGVICNGIDTESFSPPPNRPMNGRIKLLTVCRLIARKRIHILIDAVCLLKQHGIDAELSIAGEGNLLDELKRLTDRLNIADRIHFLGLVEHDRMPSVYQQNHFFLMSSTHEGMSNAMLEAMASGLPIITTACEGTEELIDENGIIIREPEPELFARSIMEILSDLTVYRKMAETSRHTAARFSWAASARRYVDLYHRIAQQHT